MHNQVSKLFKRNFKLTAQSYSFTSLNYVYL